MKYLFSESARRTIEKLAAERTLCAFDYDGTLAPISDDPETAGMREGTRAKLSSLAALYPCVVLSGRSRPDLRSKLRGLEVHNAIGNHGAETEHAVATENHHVERWKAALNLAIDSLPGLWIEDKGFSLAVHYRHSPQKAEARRRILEATRGLDKVRVFGGKLVVNLVVDGAPHKGQALVVERARLHCDWAIYVGDDTNDEAAFALRDNTISVRIGKNRRSRALYFLRDQSEIDDFLDMLIQLRTGTESRVPDSKPDANS